jgi:F0F1-type ATP synthase delta subunit
MTGFLADRWAMAFIDLCETEAEEGLEILKLMARSLEPIEPLTGTQASLQAEKLLRTALKKAGKTGQGAETALRILILLIRKGFFKYHTQLIEEIEKSLDQKNGVARVVIETFSPLDAAVKKNFEKSLKEKTRARELRLTEKPAPELLGGYRIRIGTKLIDASLRSLLRSMARSIGG